MFKLQRASIYANVPSNKEQRERISSLSCPLRVWEVRANCSCTEGEGFALLLCRSSGGEAQTQGFPGICLGMGQSSSFQPSSPSPYSSYDPALDLFVHLLLWRKLICLQNLRTVETQQETAKPRNSNERTGNKNWIKRQLVGEPLPSPLR